MFPFDVQEQVLRFRLEAGVQVVLRQVPNGASETLEEND